jgi:hypothetical protein
MTFLSIPPLAFRLVGAIDDYCTAKSTVSSKGYSDLSINSQLIPKVILARLLQILYKNFSSWSEIQLCIQHTRLSTSQDSVRGTANLML